ncbi:hypothetical protein JCM1393_20900 [Clostridium carnis]
MLEARLRDVKTRGRSLRNAGYTTGTLKRKNGEVQLISVLGYKLETYLLRNGLNSNMEINFNGETLNTKIFSVQRDVIKHNVINLDLIEI